MCVSFNANGTRNLFALSELQPRDFFLRHPAEVSALERGGLLKTWGLFQKDAPNLRVYRPVGREIDN